VNLSDAVFGARSLAGVTGRLRRDIHHSTERGLANATALSAPPGHNKSHYPKFRNDPCGFRSNAFGVSPPCR